MTRKNDRTKVILELVDRLSDEIRLARSLSLGDAARIIEIAQLDLKMAAHEITYDELREFTALVTNAVYEEEATNKVKKRNA